MESEHRGHEPQDDADSWPHDTRTGSFLSAPVGKPGARRLYDEDADELGYVTNLSRTWGHLPRHHQELFDLVDHAAEAAGLSLRDRGVLVTSATSTLGDAYCALAYGKKLSGEASGGLAAAVLAGRDEGLSPREVALARWARQVTRDPNATTPASVEELRAAGFDESEILALTLYVGLRIAFATVNDALGARPDAELAEAVPAEVRTTVTWGRPPGP